MLTSEIIKSVHLRWIDITARAAPQITSGTRTNGNWISVGGLVCDSL